MADASYDVPVRNIRETLKWLIAAFAAPLAIAVGISPLTRLNSLEGPRLCVALLGGATGVVVALLALHSVSKILVHERVDGRIRYPPFLVRMRCQVIPNPNPF